MKQNVLSFVLFSAVFSGCGGDHVSSSRSYSCTYIDQGKKQCIQSTVESPDKLEGCKEHGASVDDFGCLVNETLKATCEKKHSGVGLFTYYYDLNLIEQATKKQECTASNYIWQEYTRIYSCAYTMLGQSMCWQTTVEPAAEAYCGIFAVPVAKNSCSTTGLTGKCSRKDSQGEIDFYYGLNSAQKADAKASCEEDGDTWSE